MKMLLTMMFIGLFALIGRGVKYLINKNKKDI